MRFPDQKHHQSRGFPEFTRRWSLLMVLFSPTIMQSCGATPDPYERLAVSGTVQVNGKPLEKGRITFLPEKGVTGPVTGADIQQGIFRIDRKQGPSAGQHRVKILGLRETGRMLSAGEGSDDGDSSAPLIAEIEQFIPPNYNDESTLTVDVTPTTARDLTFDLEVPQRSPPSSKAR